MLKKFSVIILILVFAFIGCNSTNNTNNENSASAQQNSVYPYTFTDSQGNAVTLEKAPENVAVLYASYDDIWNMSGGKTAITVKDSIERGYADDNAILVDDGAGLSIDTELLLASEPDFVIGSADVDAQVQACNKLSEMGISTALFTEETMDDYLSILKIFTDITGNSTAYESYGTKVQEETKNILEQVKAYISDKEPISVLFIRAGTGYSATKAKTAANNFVGKMLEDLGTVNIADKAGNLSDGLSLESIVENQPDYIFVVPQGDEEAVHEYMDSVLAEKGWSDLDAIKNNHFYYLPKDLFHYKPNSRWAEAYKYLADILYNGVLNEE